MRCTAVAIFSLCISATGCAPPAHPPNSTRLEIKIRPPIWPQAHPITCHCGAFQDQAVLRAHGKKLKISQLYVSEWARAGCHTLPWDIPVVLNRYGGMHAKSFYYFSNAAFMEITNRSLKKDHPLIVLIQATKGFHGLHWISIWGFDPRRQVFDVYDSQYPTKVGGLGNTSYSAAFVESRFPFWVRVAVEAE